MSQDKKLENRFLFAEVLRLKNKFRYGEMFLRLDLDNSYISKIEKGRINITSRQAKFDCRFFGVK